MNKQDGQPTVSNPLEHVVSCDLHVQILCDFVLAHSEHNNENCLNNKDYKPVSSFLIEYCQGLRSKSN